MELNITFRSCIPRVSFRALPSLPPGLCRGIVPTALIMCLNFDAVTFVSVHLSISSIILYLLGIDIIANFVNNL